MRCNVSPNALQLTFHLAASVSWLSCRRIAKFTGTSIQTVANYRKLANKLRKRLHDVTLHTLTIKNAPAIARSLGL
jgi:hypothetical protein